MRTIQKIIPDLGNGLSGLKGVFDKISKEMGFALSPREFVRIIQAEDYHHLSDLRRITAFEMHFY